MNRFNKYQIWATICIAVFIISFSIGVLSRDRHCYRVCVDNYYADYEDKDVVAGELTKGQLKMCYDLLADEVTSFVHREYEVPGYLVSAENTDRLKAINSVCRGAWMLTVVCFVGYIYCFILLSRRRMYMPLAYGSAFAALLTSILALFVLVINTPLLSGVKRMLLYRNYDYFAHGDIVKMLVVPDFARYLAVEFLIIEAVVILVFVTMNFMIKRSGRPHEF